MTEPTLLAIDQGTTSTRAMIFSAQGALLAAAQRPLSLHCPHKGWVEQDPEEIWADTLAVCHAAIASHPDAAARLAAIGITNQRETTILWDRRTGTPLYNAIVWQDRRTAARCESLKNGYGAAALAARTGLVFDPYFSATKIAWILDTIDGAREAALAGHIAFGTVDTFLLWRLTGGRIHATDATNASRTLLFNLGTQSWDPALLDLFGIPAAILPAVRDCVSDFGATDSDLFERTIPILGMAGDQHASLVGQACFAPGMVKATYGTGCFALMNAGTRFVPAGNGLLSTLAYRIGGVPTFAVEGSIFSAGAAVQWLRDGLGLVVQAAESEALALSVSDSNGVYLVPAFTGLGSPYWNAEARAAIMGLTRESRGAHIVRAALEAQGYQSRDLFDAMAAESGALASVVRADGGLVDNAFVCRFVADMLGRPLEIPRVTETTALGAAFLAGMGAGVYSGLDAIAARWHCARRYEPSMDPVQRAALYQGWQSAVRGVLGMVRSGA